MSNCLTCSRQMLSKYVLTTTAAQAWKMHDAPLLQGMVTKGLLHVQGGVWDHHALVLHCGQDEPLQLWEEGAYFPIQAPLK